MSPILRGMVGLVFNKSNLFNNKLEYLCITITPSSPSCGLAKAEYIFSYFPRYKLQSTIQTQKGAHKILFRRIIVFFIQKDYQNWYWTFKSWFDFNCVWFIAYDKIRTHQPIRTKQRSFPDYCVQWGTNVVSLLILLLPPLKENYLSMIPCNFIR